MESIKDLTLSNETILHQVRLYDAMNKNEVIKKFIYAGLSLFVLILINDESILIRITQIFFSLLAFLLVFQGLYMLLTSEQENLVVTNYRLFFERRNKVKVIKIWDYHYEFFESIELLYDIPRTLNLIPIIPLFLGGFLVSTGLMLQNFDLVFLAYLGAGFIVVSIIQIIFSRLEPPSTTECNIILTTGNQINLRINPKTIEIGEIYEIYADIVKYSRQFIEG